MNLPSFVQFCAVGTTTEEGEIEIEELVSPKVISLTFPLFPISIVIVVNKVIYVIAKININLYFD